MNYELKCSQISDLSAEEVLAWKTLIECSPINRRAFLTPSYCNVVAETGAKVHVALIFADFRIVGVFPFQFKDGLLGSLGIVEPVSGVLCDYFGLVAEPDVRVNIYEVLKKLNLGAIDFSHLDESQASFGLVGESPRIGLRTEIGVSGELFWKQLRITDKKLVADTDRRERKLIAEHGPLEFELESCRPQVDLDELVRLKCAQYKRTGKLHAPLFEAENVALLHRLLLCRDSECSGLLSVLRVDGRLVAAHFGLRIDSTLHYWFPVYDEAFQAYSPGRILLKHVILAASQMGIHKIDRGEGDTPAKRDFANEEHKYYRGLWASPSLRGIIARLAMSIVWRLGR